MQPETNYRGDTNTTPQQAPKSSPKSHLIWGALTAALLGGNVYQYTHTQQVEEQKGIVTTQLNTTIVEKDTLQSEYNAAIARLDDLTSKNTALNTEIKNENGAVARLKRELAGIMSKQKRTAADNDKAKGLLTALNMKVAGYEQQIAQLKGENTQLTTQNNTLTQQKAATEEKVKDLTAKGSVLHASNIRLETIKLKKHGTKEVETSKAKKTDLLRITFDIDENRIAENGKKQVFIRITNPNGDLLSNAAYGSGNITDASGKVIGYSISKTIDLAQGQNSPNISTDWHQEDDYQAGDYTVTLYNDGFKIGSGIVHLR